MSRARNIELAAACRGHGVLFFAGSSHGLVGVFASDLGSEHRFKAGAGTTQGGVGEAFKEDAAAAVGAVSAPPYEAVVRAGPASVAPMISRRRRLNPSAATNDAAPSWAAVQGERVTSPRRPTSPPG